MRTCIPTTKQLWEHALRTATAENSEIIDDWLVVPPASHSLAAIYPLYFACSLGVRTSLRIPRSRELRALQAFACWLQERFPHFHVLAKSTDLLSEKTEWRGGGLILFGSDGTVDKFRTRYQQHSALNTFGDTLTVSVCDDSCSLESLRNLCDDAFSYGQKGCLSTRLLIVGCKDRGTEQAFIKRLAKQTNATGVDIGKRSRWRLNTWETNCSQTNHWDIIYRERESDVLFTGKICGRNSPLDIWNPDMLLNEVYALPILFVAEEKVETWLSFLNSSYELYNFPLGGSQKQVGMGLIWDGLGLGIGDVKRSRWTCQCLTGRKR